MDKKHIAMFISSLNKGGSERVLVNLAGYFYRRGYAVTIMTQYRTENEYEIDGGIQRVYSEIPDSEIGKSRVINFIKRFRRLRNIWKKIKPDLILSFIGKNNMMAILTSRFLSIPVVISVRGEPKEEYYSKVLRWAAMVLFPMADGVVLQSRRSLDFFSRSVQKKAVILPNSIHPAFMREVYAGEREKKIVAVGRVDANKNHILIIKAFASLAERYPDYELVIYGEGELRSGLLEQVREMGLQDRVHLPGSISDVADAIYKASVFVLSSNSEGMPNTLMEAMALGIPSVATDCPCGGPAELIENGVNGLLTEVDNWRKMEENLQKIIGDKDFANKLSKNAAKIKEKLNPDLINAKWEEYFCRMMERKGRRRRRNDS